MKKYLMLLLILSLLGCTTVRTSVDSLSSSIGAGNKYYIIPFNSEITDSDLLFIEFSNLIEIAFSQNGYIRVDGVEDADQIVFIDYGISDPQNRTGSYSTPQYGVTGSTGSTTTGTINSSGQFNSTTTNYNTYGVTGYNNYTYNYNVYLRSLYMESYVMSSLLTDKPIQIWRLQVNSEGSSGDLREIMPYLVYSSEPYIGKNTRKMVRKEIYSFTEGLQKYMQ